MNRFFYFRFLERKPQEMKVVLYQFTFSACFPNGTFSGVREVQNVINPILFLGRCTVIFEWDVIDGNVERLKNSPWMGKEGNLPAYVNAIKENRGEWFLSLYRLIDISLIQ